MLIAECLLLPRQLLRDFFHDLRAKIGHHAVHDTGNRARVRYRRRRDAAAAAMAFGASSAAVSTSFAASTHVLAAALAGALWI